MKLGIGLSIPLLAAMAHHGGGTPAPTPTPILSPGITWDGTATSGGTAPAESGTPWGILAQDERPSGGFSVVAGSWIHGTGIKVSLIWLPSQDPTTTTINYPKEVMFWLNGNSVTVTDWSVNDTPVMLPDGTIIPQGSIGYAVEIGPGTGSVTAGDMILYAYMRGEHGLERRVQTPLVNNVDRSLDPVGIDVTATPSGTSGTLTVPWTGASGSYTAWFSSATVRASRTVTLTNGSTAIGYSSAPAASSSTRIWLNRPKYFIDPVDGNDSNIGNKPGSGNAWKSFLKAGPSVPSGALVEMANGTYVEDSNSATVTAIARVVEFRPSASWTDASDITITRTNRLIPSRDWNARIQRAHIFGVTVDLSKMAVIYASLAPSILAFSASRLLDTDANGPKDANGYDIGYNVTTSPTSTQDGAGVLFQGSNGSRIYLTECELRNYQCVGAWLYRNVTAEYSADAWTSGGNSAVDADMYDNVVVDGYFTSATRSFQQRYHVETELTVASATKDSPSAGKTRFAISGSPNMFTHAGGPDTGAQIVTGALAGTYAACTAMSGTAFTVDVTGDFSAVEVGAKIRCFVIWHPDFAQQNGANSSATSRGMRNIVFSRYDGIGPYTQLFLVQGTAGWSGTPTLRTFGTDGKDIELSSAQSWRDSDVVRVTNGPQAGQARMMDGDGTGVSIGRLKDAFTALQNSGTTSVRGKTWDGLAMYCCRLRKTSFTSDPAVPGRLSNEFGQFAEGAKNCVLAHNTFLGRRQADLATIGFRNGLISTGQAGNSAHGHRSNKWLFNVIGQMYSDAAPFPTDGVKLQRNQFMTGTDPDGSGQVGGTVLDPDTSLPGPGFLPVGVRPLVGFDFYGRPITSASPCGFTVS